MKPPPEKSTHVAITSQVKDLLGGGFADVHHLTPQLSAPSAKLRNISKSVDLRTWNFLKLGVPGMFTTNKKLSPSLWKICQRLENFLPHLSRSCLEIGSPAKAPTPSGAPPCFWPWWIKQMAVSWNRLDSARPPNRESGWWLTYVDLPLPLWKIWVRQMGWLFPIYGKIYN